MRYRKTYWFIGLIVVLASVGFLGLSILRAPQRTVYAQFPTVSIPTVTSSPRGPYIRVLVTSTEYDPINVRSGPIPLLEPPPTETPAATYTSDPTFGAQFIITVQPTRLPTYTEPPPLNIPTFETDLGTTAPGGLPVGLVIVVLAGLGVFLTIIAILRRG